MRIEATEPGATFLAGRSTDSYDYFDLYLGYCLYETNLALSLAKNNLTEEELPVLGNEAGDISSNLVNMLPSNYNVYGGVWPMVARMTL